MTELKEFDTVRVLAFPLSVDGVSACVPGVGDRGAVVQVLGYANGARYMVESVDSEGRTRWLAEFSSDALTLTKSEASASMSFHAMASGQRYLLLMRDVSWQMFPECAQQWVERLKAQVVDTAQDPSEQIWTLLIDAQRFWLSWEDFGGEVSLEPCDADAGRLMPALRQRLAAARAPFDVSFSTTAGDDQPSRLKSGCAELDFFLNDELRDGGDAADTIDESLTLELAHQIQDIRAGRIGAARNGSDAMFVTLAADGVLLEYAIPGSNRPGPTITFHSFADVFVRWFELVNPPLGARIRAVVWPRSLSTEEP